jgi:signal peptidase II
LPLPQLKGQKLMPYVLLSALIVVLDQWYKGFISRQLVRVGSSAAFLPGVLQLTLVHNYGASWGILAGKTTLLLAVTALVCAAILCVILLGKPAAVLGRISLAFILGGAVGNALDRFLQGYVIDMFETQFMDFPVFNVADCFITVGAVLMCLWVLGDEKKNRLERQEASRRRWEKSREAAKKDAALAEQTRREFDENDDVSDR